MHKFIQIYHEFFQVLTQKNFSHKKYWLLQLDYKIKVKEFGTDYLGLIQSSIGNVHVYV